MYVFYMSSFTHVKICGLIRNICNATFEYNYQFQIFVYFHEGHIESIPVSPVTSTDVAQT